MESSVLSVYMVSSDSLAQGIVGPEGSRGLNCVMEVSERMCVRVSVCGDGTNEKR